MYINNQDINAHMGNILFAKQKITHMILNHFILTENVNEFLSFVIQI